MLRPGVADCQVTEGEIQAALMTLGPLVFLSYMSDMMGKDLDVFKKVPRFCTVNILRICVFPGLISAVIILIIVKYSQKMAINITVLKVCFKNPHRNFLVHSTIR